jgi:mannose-6-phosphate isomerase-like protein (cupin superfamily)
MEVKIMDKVNIRQKLNLIKEYWKPKIIGEFNDSYIKLGKLKGEFVWHQHEKEDEVLFVMKGILIVKLKEREIILNEGEFFIVPKGVEHVTIGEEEVHLMMIEPKSTLNTGNVKAEKTVEQIEWI